MCFDWSIHDYKRNMDGDSHFFEPTKSIGRTYVVSTQTDEATGHSKSPRHIRLEERSNVSQNSSAQSHEYAARVQRGIYFIPDDPDYEEIMNNARRKLEVRRASAMPCNVTTPVNPNGSGWERSCASDWSEMETKRLNSPCSKQDDEKQYHGLAKTSNHREYR